MNPELIEKFIEVTGGTEATAHQYLSLTDGNVEAAISLMFEGGQAPEPELVNLEPEVRPPILPTQEVLVPSDPVCSFPRLSNNVYDTFRDFAVETQRQEEEMTRRVGIKHISQRKSKRLEDLFRPPCNILFLGSFLEARDRAKKLNRWLLVNIQNPQEFDCQILNRDVWSNQQIQEIVKDHFVLWQVLSNTSDGKRYIDLYKVTEYPYLALIDPRTGECMQTYNRITVDILMSVLNDMLSTYPSPECVTNDSFHLPKNWESSTASTTKNSVSNSMMNDSSSSSSKSSSTSSSSSSKTTRPVFDNLSDLKNHNGTTTIQSSSSSTTMYASQNISKKRRMDESDVNKQNQETIAKDETAEVKSDSNKIKTSSESIRLCLRLPSGKKETISMYAVDTVEDFVNKMQSMGFPPSDHTYLVPFPKTNIGELSPETHLSNTILFPANTVFITKI
ncbi:UBX domain-containing protein 7 [Calliopsis andreniformis]|uniref:UBX domain-containing protein 7 n=1 Tax=Calliopsis andreniformis TaxID=337506 RepID=UPI003FCE8DF0